MSMPPTPPLPEPESFSLKGAARLGDSKAPARHRVRPSSYPGGSSGDPPEQRGAPSCCLALSGLRYLSGEGPWPNLVKVWAMSCARRRRKHGLLITSKCASADSPGPAAPAADMCANPLLPTTRSAWSASSPPPQSPAEDPFPQPIRLPTSSNGDGPMPDPLVTSELPPGDPPKSEAATNSAAQSGAGDRRSPPTQRGPYLEPSGMAGLTNCSGDGNPACRAQRRPPWP